MRDWFIFLGLLLTPISSAYAFYETESGNINREARGLLLAGTSVADTASANILSTRLMYDADFNNWHFEYQQLWQQVYNSIGNDYETKADRLNIGFSNEQFYLKIGRQAVSLATTFYFSPNDFFAPFTIQSLNRDFKQGVDAVYSELQVGELSTLSMILVNNQDDNLNTSSILRFESTLENISWMIFIGELNQTLFSSQQIFGGSLQADLFDNLGIRAEGHSSKQAGQDTSEWVLGLEQRLNDDTTWSAEWFYHGAAAITPHLPYAGKQYLALGLTYQFTPLLLANFSLIRNMDDQSQLNTAYINYSLSNESTVNLSVLLPKGESTTEFGLYPRAYALDYQIYF